MSILHKIRSGNNNNGSVVNSVLPNGTIISNEANVVSDLFYSGISSPLNNRLPEYVRYESIGGGSSWGAITGTLSNQTDLNSALSGKQNSDIDLDSVSALNTVGFVYRAASNNWSTRTNVATTFADGTNGINRFQLIWSGGAEDSAAFYLASTNDSLGLPTSEFVLTCNVESYFTHGNSAVRVSHNDSAKIVSDVYEIGASAASGGYVLSHPEEFRNAIGLGTDNDPEFNQINADELMLYDSANDGYSSITVDDGSFSWMNIGADVRLYAMPISGGSFIGRVSFSGTTNPGLTVNNLTAAQRDALSTFNGTLIYNTDTNQINSRHSTGWRQLIDNAGGQTIAANLTIVNCTHSSSGNFSTIINSQASGGLIIRSSGSGGNNHYDGTSHIFRNGNSSTTFAVLDSASFRPGVTATTDIGTTSLRLRDGWFSRDINLNGLLNLGDYTVGTLPSAASSTGCIANVTDSSVNTWGTNVSGGGANNVTVRSDGTNWKVFAI